ncbi:MAG: hypothetical protein WAN14_17145 [Candidatus Acidiferrales bacterium]
MTPISNAHHCGDRHTKRHSALRTKLAFCAAFLALSLAAALPAAAQDQKDSQQSDNDKDKDGIGFNLGQNTSAKDVGLPLYPGSRRHKDNDDDSSALNMGLWGGSSGLKLFVLKMETSDAPEKVAAFYRKALAKYGTVLDCTNAQPSDATAPEDNKKKSSKALTCEDEKPKPGEISLKSGTKSKEHAVGIQAQATGTLYQLVYVETRGTND